MQEKEEQRYQQKLLEKQMERERRKQEKQLGNQQELLGERQKGKNVLIYCVFTSSKVKSQSY